MRQLGIRASSIWTFTPRRKGHEDPSCKMRHVVSFILCLVLLACLSVAMLQRRSLLTADAVSAPSPRPDHHFSAEDEPQGETETEAEPQAAVVPSTCVQERNWGVMTTINGPTEAVRRVAALPGWHVVVVGDLKSDDGLWTDYVDANPNVVYLSVARQLELDLELVSKLPYNHYSRKNIGYLYAIRQNAAHVYDFDDDNVLRDGMLAYTRSTPGPCLPVIGRDSSAPPLRVFVPASADLAQERQQPPVANPYAYFGQPELWPRGLPLQELHETANPRHAVADASLPSNVAVFQGLADVDPDVDAIWRIAHTAARPGINVAFDSSLAPLAIPTRTFAPFNSQNTVFAQRALWLLYLPVTTAFRVTDIWRGYWAQRLLWETGSVVAFYPPSVVQYRNAHGYVADLEDEFALYRDAPRLLRLLAAWKWDRTRHRDLAAAGVALMQEMAAHGFVELVEVDLLAAWTRDLARIGYKFNVDPRASASARPPAVAVMPRQQQQLRVASVDPHRAASLDWWRHHEVRPTAMRTLSGSRRPAAASTTNARPCPLDNVDLVLFTGKRDLLTLDYLWKSIDLFVPCYRRLVVTSDTAEDLLAVATTVPSHLPNVVLLLESYPPAVASLPMFDKSQWGNWWADNYTDAEYVLFLDSDSLFSLPVTCSALFEPATGRPYWFYWPHAPRFSAATNRILRGSGLLPTGKASKGNFMAYFPIVVRREWLALARRVATDAVAGARSFDEAFASLVRADPASLSQFHAIGNIVAHYAPQQVALAACPPQKTSDDVPEPCRTHPFAGLHVAYPHQTVTQDGSAWRIETWNAAKYGKFGDTYVELAQRLLTWGRCFVEFHYGSAKQPGDRLLPGCTEHDAWTLPNDVFAYPGLLPRNQTDLIRQHLLQHNGGVRRCSDGGTW